jgi:hypothetical protein
MRFGLTENCSRCTLACELTKLILMQYVLLEYICCQENKILNNSDLNSVASVTFSWCINLSKQMEI